MAINQPLLPVLGPPPLRDPIAVPDPTPTIPPAPTPSINGTYQRWLTQIFRAVTSLIGSNSTPALTVAGTQYRWMTALRIEIPQSAIASLVAVLGAQDVGLLMGVTDYNHVLEWMGTKLQFAPGDSGSNWYSAGPAPGTAPTAPGWHACDGSNISYLNPDGTLTPLVLPTTPGMWFRQ